MAEAPEEEREPRKRPSRRKTAVERVRTTRFPAAMRGYDRDAVDRYVADVAQIVSELESNQLRENVVQRALDEVGEQTSSILQRAHETAEEIEVRSRSQAEGRLQRAEREAEVLRRDAERYAEELATETQRLWEDRVRMIEEMRQLADEVLGVADDALERLPEPEALLGGGEEQPDQEFAPVLEEASDETVAAEVVELPPPAEPDFGPPAAEPPAEDTDESEPTNESTVEFPSQEQQPPQQPPPRN